MPWELEVLRKHPQYLDAEQAFGLALKEKQEAFLEKYAADVLYSYTPVDGVDITCSPKIWKTRDVVNDLKSGLEANIGALKVQGDYYTLSNKKDQFL